MTKLWEVKQLCRLSDDQVEYQALDRVTLQRFLGLQPSSRISDSKTFWVFQQILLSVDVAPVIAEAVQQQLAVSGTMAPRHGQWVDASIIRAPVQHKVRRGRPLSTCQKGRNRRIAKVRARVEHVFAGLHHMGWQEIRTIGLARAQFQITTKLAVYNFKCWVSIRKYGIIVF